jgi:hypothetical protein
VSTLLSWVALWALGFVRASGRARTGGCGSGSSLTKLAGPFCQVGDEQAIALRKLAHSFVSAKPKRANTKLAPQDESENSAPQRAQTKASPPRVAGQAPRQTSLQHNMTSQSTPNSNCTQHTPRRRVVTPQTPHGMVRWSARQQNVSQDMMAETLSQANHCFSISTKTK